MFFFFKHLRICLLAGNINGEIAGEFTVGWFYFTEELKRSLRFISNCAYFLLVCVDFTCSTFFFLRFHTAFSANLFEQFSIECWNNPGLLWFRYVLPCDWSRKLVPISRPIKCKTITNHDLVPRVFPRFLRLASFYFEFPHWLFRVFSKLLFLQESLCWNFVVIF